MERTLKSFTNADLLQELFSRYDEAVFIAHRDSESAPIHMALHMPHDMTTMHTVLPGAFEKLAKDLRGRYRVAPDVQPIAGPALAAA